MRAASRQMIRLGGGPLQLGPPSFRFILLAPGFIELHDPLGGFGQVLLVRRGDFCLAGLHALVPLDDERLGLGELLLAQQAGAELGVSLEGSPVVGLQ